MIIGLDIDDTVIDEVDTFLSCAHKYCEMHGKPYCLNSDNDQHTRDLFSWSYDEEIGFWSIYGSKILSLPPRKDAVIFIKKAFTMHEVHFISARTSEGVPEIQQFTEKYFALYDIPYTRLVTGVKDKKEYCKRHMIDVFYDDNLTHCENVSSLNIPVFWMTTLMNKEKVTSISNIIRISSFDYNTQILKNVEKVG